MAANPGPPPSTAQPQGGNTGDVELTTTDEVKEYCHEGDGENDEYLNSMDLHDIKSELEKDAEEAETPKSNSMIASSSSPSVLHTNSTNTSINSQTIQFRPTVVLPYGQGIGIPYGYPTSFMSGLPIDQSLRSGYPFLMPGQYVTQMPYTQQQLSLSFGTTPIAPNAAVHPHSGMMIPQQKEKKPHIKKPLNAFMLFMKEKRAEVMKDRTLKESAAINQILGKMWHKLDKSEQAKYYEMAREERAKHMQMYPGWSARDNYAVHKKRKKKKPTKLSDTGSEDGYGSDSNCTTGDPQKCRARFGMEQQAMWCFGCRKKKKCIRSNGVENNAAVPFVNQSTVNQSTVKLESS